MPRPQLRNHAIPWSLGRASLRPLAAARVDVSIMFGPQSGNWAR
jgi:hypothetical protein